MMNDVKKINFRKEVIQSYCRKTSVVEELLAYNAHVFSAPDLNQVFPLQSEPHVERWREYLKNGARASLYEEISQRLVQLKFPIKAGMSSDEAYREATRKGIDSWASGSCDGLVLEEPERLELMIYPTLAGEIPVLEVGNRGDFENLIRALFFKNEPKPIPKSMGAIMIAGYSNWDRIHLYRQAWERDHPDGFWPMEFSHFLTQKELYQDRFIILSEGPYSSVPAEELGLDHASWLRLSKMIRREHECAHYFTRRVFSSMRNNIIDELIADYMGIVAANGAFRADWFNHFMGIASLPDYQVGRRLENYRENLSDDAFEVLQHLTKAASENLQTFDQAIRAKGFGSDSSSKAHLLMALTRLTLEELASDEGAAKLDAYFHSFERGEPPAIHAQK